MPVINISSTLRERLGDNGADDLVDLINRATEETKEDVLTLVEEKFERRLAVESESLRRYINGETIQLDKRITKVGADLDKRITDVAADLDKRIARVDNRITEETQQLRVELAQTRADLIRWMFIFWVGQVAAILGILFAFFR